jgi:hypothetical protein
MHFCISENLTPICGNVGFCGTQSKKHCFRVIMKLLTVARFSQFQESVSLVFFLTNISKFHCSKQIVIWCKFVTKNYWFMS